jgi:hypothetical protein
MARRAAWCALRTKLKVVARARSTRARRNKPSIEASGPSQPLDDSLSVCNELKGTLTSASSVISLSPVTSSAQDDSTSELLRFL